MRSHHVGVLGSGVDRSESENLALPIEEQLDCLGFVDQGIRRRVHANNALLLDRHVGRQSSRCSPLVEHLERHSETHSTSQLETDIENPDIAAVVTYFEPYRVTSTDLPPLRGERVLVVPLCHARTYVRQRAPPSPKCSRWSWTMPRPHARSVAFRSSTLWTPTPRVHGSRRRAY